MTIPAVTCVFMSLLYIKYLHNLYFLLHLMRDYFSRKKTLSYDIFITELTRKQNEGSQAQFYVNDVIIIV